MTDKEKLDRLITGYWWMHGFLTTMGEKCVHNQKDIDIAKEQISILFNKIGEKGPGK
jgi:hypothetical protein